MRTIFNILGPLTNPADAPNILMGVFHPDLVGIQVRVLQRLGAEHVVVVYGMDGMDEISLGAATMVGELKDGEVREYEIHPRTSACTMASNRALQGRDAGAVEGDAAARCSPTSRARRATSCCSTPARRCTAADVAPSSMAEGVAARARAPSASGAALGEADASSSRATKRLQAAHER